MVNVTRAALVCGLFIACVVWAADMVPPPTVLEDFQSFSVGATPDKGWKTREGDPKGVYRVAEEPGGNRYLEARDTGTSIQFFRSGGWDIRKFPCLSWRWKVRQFPAGADERVSERNDSAAGLYVLFPKRFLIPEAIKYVWSEKVPVETKIVRRQRFPMIVVRSGTEGKGEWRTETRCVATDYERHFGRRAPDPVAIGFLTDANAVKGTAEADYDDVRADKAR